MIPDNIIENQIRLFTLKDLDEFERAELIRKYMDTHDLSQREFCKMFGIAKSTLNNWLAYNESSKEEITDLIDQGHSKTEITTELRRHNIKSLKIQNRDYFYVNKLLNRIIGVFSKILRNVSWQTNSDTLKLLDRIQDKIDAVRRKALKIKE